MKPRVASIERTCWAFPSQWEGTFADGRVWYARFRGGRGYVAACVDDGTPYCAVDGERLIEFKSQGAFDGFMSDVQFLRDVLSVVADIEGVAIVTREPEDEMHPRHFAIVPLSVCHRPPQAI